MISCMPLESTDVIPEIAVKRNATSLIFAQMDAPSKNLKAEIVANTMSIRTCHFNGLCTHSLLAFGAGIAEEDNWVHVTRVK